MDKSILKIVGIFALVVACFGFVAYRDYTWDNTVIKDKGSEGYILAETRHAFIEDFRPWELFCKAPVSELSFIKPNEFVEVKDDFVFGEILSIERGEMFKTRENKYQTVFDCKNNMFSYTGPITTVNDVNFAELEWDHTVGVNNRYNGIASIVCR